MAEVTPVPKSYRTLYHDSPWRTGRKVHRTIYATQSDGLARDSDQLIGMMDTREAAREAVDAHNAALSARQQRADGK